RPDFPRAALVCHRTGEKLDGGHLARFCGRGRIHRSCSVEAFHLVRRPRALHAHELLGRTAARPGSLKDVEVAAEGGVCLSYLSQHSATRQFLEMQSVRTAV